jgi:hypothetical protein
MLYIGTSLGGCLRSIMANEVSEDEVLLIVTRTYAPEYTDFVSVVTQYHQVGNPYTRRHNYELGAYPFDEVLSVAKRLWDSGKIHQPRIFNGNSGPHLFEYGTELWLQVVPTNTNNNPAVIEAYNKYKMLDLLTR